MKREAKKLIKGERERQTEQALRKERRNERSGK